MFVINSGKELTMKVKEYVNGMGGVETGAEGDFQKNVFSAGRRGKGRGGAARNSIKNFVRLPGIFRRNTSSCYGRRRAPRPNNALHCLNIVAELVACPLFLRDTFFYII